MNIVVGRRSCQNRSMDERTLVAGLEGRDHLSLKVRIRAGKIESAELRAKGCPALLAAAASWRAKLHGPVAALPLPEGCDHCGILMRELILKLKESWAFPYNETELCHCRAVPTAVVDASVVMGAATVKQVGRKTSAGTGCGTCQKDIQSVIRYRRGG